MMSLLRSLCCSWARGWLYLFCLACVVAGAPARADVELPNGSFEQGQGEPAGWKLKGDGEWVKSGHSGDRCVSVTGNGSNNTYWRCETMPLEPSSVYRVAFYVKSETSGGCIISGSTFANRDIDATDEWQRKTFIFKTPADLPGGYIRFGQWHADGRVWFDDIEFTKVQVVNRRSDGIALGVGEYLQDGTYHYRARLSKESSNYSRPCVRHTCGFNSNRWTLGSGDRILYEFHIPGHSQRSGTFTLTMGYYRSGSCSVEVRPPGGEWSKVDTFGESGKHTVELPPRLFPAKALQVRLQSTGSFQIDDCTYSAALTDRPRDARGTTCFLDIEEESGDVAVAVRSLGSLLPGTGNQAALAVRRKGTSRAKLEARLQMIPAEGEKVENHATLAAEREGIVRIPYRLTAAGQYKLRLMVADAETGEEYYRAESAFQVPHLYAADYGHSLQKTRASALWWCGPTHKVSRQRPAPSEGEKAVGIAASKGEYEPFQLVLRASERLEKVRVQTSALEKDEENRIPADNIRVERVGYVPVTVPTDSLGCIGDWPDPLPPCDAPFTVKADTNQPLWITVRVPRETETGAYTGTVHIRPEDAPDMTAQVNLQVYDFAIPRREHLKVTMNLSRGPLRSYHNLETDEQLDEVYHLYNRNMARHRISNFNVMQRHRPDVTFHGRNWNGGTKVQKSFEGKRSLLVVDEDSDGSVGVKSRQFIRVRPGRTYEFSWAAKAEEGHAYMVSLNQHDGDREWISGQNIDIRRTGSGQWKTEKIRIKQELTQRTRYVRVVLRPAVWTKDGEKTGRACFDRVSLRRVPDGKNKVKEPGFETTAEDLRVELDFSGFDRAGRRYLDKLGFNAFTVPLYGFGGGTFHSHHAGEILGYKQGSPEYRALFGQYCTKLVDHLQEKGWYEESCVYWFDEPRQDDYDFVQKGMKALERADPRLKRMLTEQPEEELYGYVDIWMPALHRYDKEKARARQKKGEKVWWYICTAPNAPYPNNFIDHPAIEPRIWFWMTWQNDVTGCHIWRVNYWTSRLAFPGSELQNPYEDPMSYVSGYGREEGHIGYWGNGDGRIIYPPNRHPNTDDTTYVRGPVNSIRWELIREGIEDYEYFHLLERLTDRLEKKGGAPKLVDRARNLLDIPSGIIRSLTRYTRDAEKLRAYRRRVARMIERIRSRL